MRRFLPILAMLLPGSLLGQHDPASGANIYAQHCASCHGEDGEGNPDECEDPLYGDRSLTSLSKYIHKRMPEDEPELVQDEDARQVANYIYSKFYSPQSRAGTSSTPEKAFARLTNRQFRESVADLIGGFGKSKPPGEGIGLKAQYFQSDGMNKKSHKALERIDRVLSFDFAEAAPVEGISADQFSIAWDGSLIAPATGWYEFRLSTPNGARVYLNGDRQDGDGNSRDDSGAKRQVAFIDSWVSSGTEVREVSARIFLLGGRSYPFRLDYFKYKDARGMVRLDWKPPGAEWAPLAAPFLSPDEAVHVAIVDTTFPPDDASEGYERGTDISKEWHEATTAAAINVANQVLSRLPRISGIRDDDPDRTEKLKKFIGTFAERAFRRPLDAAQTQLYIDRCFLNAASPEQAVKRAVILILKSPRFLYPEVDVKKDDYFIASQLALGVWDSLPDSELLEAAATGKLRSYDEVKLQTQRMVHHPRAKAKLHEFFQRWLKLDAEGDLRKDPREFPDFDANLVADLRRSLELFVDRVVWSEPSDYRELIEADYLLFNDRLAGFYQVPIPKGEGFQPVKFDPAQRSGVITHPYLLARLAHPDVTSPIHRGVFITRNVLGGILKPPPEAIAFENHKFDPDMTVREKVSEMTRSPTCMTCHETINPLGFSLENFDSVGRFRTTEHNKPIDPESDYLTKEGETLRLRGPRDVATYAVTSATARQGFIRQLLQFTLKQNPGVYGSETVAQLDDHFATSGFNIRNLVVEINTHAAMHGVNTVNQASR